MTPDMVAGGVKSLASGVRRLKFDEGVATSTVGRDTGWKS